MSPPLPLLPVPTCLRTYGAKPRAERLPSPEAALDVIGASDSMWYIEGHNLRSCAPFPISGRGCRYERVVALGRPALHSPRVVRSESPDSPGHISKSPISLSSYLWEGKG